MIRRRGANAAVRATQRAIALQNAGEREVASIWRRIANEIARIRTEERATYGASLALFNASNKTSTASG